MERCGKCGKKQVNYRAAFGSWKCYACGDVKENPDKTGTGDHILAQDWWNGLSANEKVETWKSHSK